MNEPEAGEAPGGVEPQVKPLEWIVDTASGPIVHADHFALQRGEEPGSYVLNLGQLDVPLVVGQPDEARERWKAVPYVPVRVIGRYSLSLLRLRQLSELLANHLQEQAGAQAQQEAEH